MIQEVWEREVAISVAPSASAEAIYLASGARLECLDARNGEPVWSTEMPTGENPVRLEASSRGVVLVTPSELVVVPLGGGAATLRVATPEFGSMLWHDSKLFMTSADHSLHCWNALDGSLAWSRVVEYGSGAIASLADEMVVVATPDGISAHDQATGDHRWSVALDLDDPMGPWATDSAVAVQSASCDWFGIGRDGTLLWSSQLPSDESVIALTRDTAVVAAIERPGLRGFSVVTGNELWTADCSLAKASLRTRAASGWVRRLSGVASVADAIWFVSEGKRSRLWDLNRVDVLTGNRTVVQLGRETAPQPIRVGDDLLGVSLSRATTLTLYRPDVT